MKRFLVSGIWVCSLILWTFLNQASASNNPAPIINYGTDGQTKVFYVQIPRNSLNVDPWAIEARSLDKKTFSVCLVRDTYHPENRYYGLSAEDQKKWEVYQQQVNEAYRQLGEVDKSLIVLQTKVDALNKILEDPELDPKTKDYLQTQTKQAKSQLDLLQKKRIELQQKYQQIQSTVPQVQWGYQEKIEASNPFIEIYGRLREGGHAELALVTLQPQGEKSERLLTIALDPPATIPHKNDLVKAWAQNWVKALSLEALAGGDVRFHLYEIRKVCELYKVDLPYFIDLIRGVRPLRTSEENPDNVDLFSVTTGGLAIQESLQFKKMLQENASSGGKRVPISSLKGPSVKSHPFEEMLKGREPVMFDTAKLVPYDQYYVHFSTIRTEIELSDLLDQWGTSLLQSMDVSSRDRKVKDRVLGQLGLELSTLTRLFGDLVVGDLAITGNDPYLTDGSDITVIFQVKNASIFEQSMELHRADVRKKRPDAETSQAQYLGVQINSLKTADREVSSYWTAFDTYRIYSNSPEAIHRVLNVANGKHPSLKNASDFRYMRTVFPGTATEEDGFLYLSDAFIRKVVGPEQKIARFRQLHCISNLRTIGNAHLHQVIESGSLTPASLVTLAENKLINAEDQQCPSGGKYSMSKDRVPSCSVHGSFRYLTPLIEIPSKDASPVEAAGYKTFVDQYNQYWSRYFDPVGIRFRLKNKIEVETCILPLIENSIYNTVGNTVGGPPVDMTPLRSKQTIGTVGLRFSPNTPGGRELIKGILLETSSKETEVFLRDLGDMITLNFCDSAPLFTFSRNLTNELMGLGWRRGEDFLIGGILSSVTLPIYLTLDVKNPAQAKKDFERVVQAATREIVMKRERYISLEPYRLNTYQGIEINVAKFMVFVVDFRFYYAFLGNKLVITTQQQVLTQLIDAYLKNPSAKVDAMPANLLLEMRPEAFDRIRPMISTHWQERMRETCLSNLLATRLFLKHVGLEPGQLNAECLNQLGYVPFCPSGGTYQINQESGGVSCSVHGSFAYPQQPIQADDSSQFINFVESIKNINVRLMYTPEGIRTRLEIDRK